MKQGEFFNNIESIDSNQSMSFWLHPTKPGSLIFMSLKYYIVAHNIYLGIIHVIT